MEQASAVGGPSLDHPSVGLVSKRGDELEIGVVVQNGEAAGFRSCCYQCINQGQGSVLALFAELRLEVKRPFVICMAGGSERKGREPFGERPVVASVASGVAKFERHGTADGHLTLGSQGRERSGHRWLRQSSEDACVSQVLCPCHLVVGPPSALQFREIESALFA